MTDRRQRGVSFTAHGNGGPGSQGGQGGQGERQPLLHDPEQASSDGYFPAQWRNPQNFSLGQHDHLPVYDSIHKIRKDIVEAIDDPYSLEQLKDPRMNASVIRPLVDKWYAAHDCSTIYCLLVNRTQFLKVHPGTPHYQSVNITRAILCELVANRILRRTMEHNPGPRGLLLLANILVAGFDPFQNAPLDVRLENEQSIQWNFRKRGGGRDRTLPALEIAIISESKTFLSSSACQKVVQAIYEGRVIYTPSSFIDIIPDHYKKWPISLYDPRKAPLLNQYRLMVPRTRNYLEIGQFIILLVLYVLVMNDRDLDTDGSTTLEWVFCIFASGWSLDQVASILEHGWGVYTQNLWSFLDVTFIFIFFSYVIVRLIGVHHGDEEMRRQAMNVLSIGAPVLIPRLAFNLLSEQLLFVSLRAMMADFTVLTLLAIWCFGGFLLSMTWLADGKIASITISKWMLWVWFGLDGTGIQRSVEMHTFLGPILMVLFAFLGNTLFLTILVSMLSNTFAGIVSNASAEIQYRRSVLTLEGVKSDAIFSYQPPANILALVILIPLKFVVTPRWFHKINVTAVRTLNAPLLLIISYLERRVLWSGMKRPAALDGMSKLTRSNSSRNGIWGIPRGFSVHGDLHAVFENTETEQAAEEEENPDDEPSAPGSPLTGSKHTSVKVSSPGPMAKARKDSMAPFGELKSALKAHLSDLIGEDGDDGEGDSVVARLDRLEGSIKRVEELLVKIAGDMASKDDMDSESDSKLAPLDDGDPELEIESHR